MSTNTKGNFMKNKFWIVAMIASSALTGCLLKNDDAIQSARQSAVGSDPGGLGGIPEQVSGKAVIGARNFSQLNASMAAATTVDPSIGEINTFYTNSKTRFSLDGQIGATSASSMLATTSLAGFYCKNLVTKEQGIADTAARIFYGNINFAQTNTQLSAAVRTAVFQKYADRFWRRAATADEISILNTLVDEAMLGVTASTAQLRNALILSCTAALNAVDFIKS